MTPQQLQNAVGCTAELAARYASPLSRACEAFGINTPVRLAAFLAQVGHESGSFRYTREMWGPTAAQLRYEGRADLGNTQPGDGALFLGRGLIQLTGRANARQARDELRRAGFDAPDFESRPELLEDDEWACLVAGWFWKSRGCNERADDGDFEAITRRINGGLNGLADRNARWESAKKALSLSPAPQAIEPEKTVIPALIPSLFGALSSALPSLVKLIRPDSESAERNAKVSAEVLRLATTTLNAANAQEAVERVQSDPAAAAAVSKAVQDNWFELAEAGGGGIDGARKADLAAQTAPGNAMLQSPSFWIAVMLLPLVYMLVASLIGLLGTATWSDDVRAGLAGSLVSAIIGGLVGYYYGQTTSRNRTTSP